MTQHPDTVAAIVLAAGLGTRMRSRCPKVLHEIAGRPMVGWVLAALEDAGVGKVVVVVGDEMQALEAVVAPHATVVQRDRLGTAHAALQAAPALEGFAGDVLILNGDNPLIPANAIRNLIAARRASPKTALSVLAFRAADPGPYGRLVLDANGGLERIVEVKDATAEERAIDLCSAGMMAVDGGLLFDLLQRVGNDNAKGEYYLPDIVALARAGGHRCAHAEGPETALLGINSRAELAAAEAAVQTALRARALDAGVTMTDPASVYLSWDTAFGQDVTVGPNVQFGPGVTVEDDAEIRAFCHIEGARIGRAAKVGPFARLRPGAELADDVHVGNFVEVKNAALGQGAKANHLTYIGDSSVGAGANIGAGTITCNYDGFFKSRTEIGAGAFIGSNTALVAPVKIGPGAIVGAGSVISRDIEADALAVTRAEQREVKGWAKRHNDKKRAEKARAKDRASEAAKGD